MSAVSLRDSAEQVLRLAAHKGFTFCYLLQDQGYHIFSTSETGTARVCKMLRDCTRRRMLKNYGGRDVQPSECSQAR